MKRQRSGLQLGWPRPALLTAALVLAAGCSTGGEDTAAVDELEGRIRALEERVEQGGRTGSTSSTSTSTVPETTASTTTTAPVAASAPDRRAEAAALFTDLVATHCDASNVPPGDTASIGAPDGSRFPVTDGDGVRLVLDVERRVVTSTDGDGGILPNNYSFGCDPAVFLGTLPN